MVLWIALYALQCAFTAWVVMGSGAHWIQGWKAPFFLDWLLSFTWTDEQIKLYVLIMWIGHTIWFFLGVGMPELRAI